LVRKIFAWKANAGDRVALNKALTYLSSSILFDWLGVIVTVTQRLFLSSGFLQYLLFSFAQTITGIFLAILNYRYPSMLFCLFFIEFK
jgi:hypothetical protein